MNINMNKELKKLHPDAVQEIKEAILLGQSMSELLETSQLIKENSKRTVITVNTKLFIQILEHLLITEH